MWLRERNSSPNDRGFQKLMDQIEETEAIFYESRTEDDPILPRMNSAVETIEQICRSVQMIELSFWKRLKNKWL